MPETIEDRIGAFLEQTDDRFRPDDQKQEIEQKEELEAESSVSEESEVSSEPESSSDDETQEDIQEGIQEVSLSTLSELAEHLEVDIADLYGLKIPITDADGSKKEVSIGEWKDSFRETAVVKAERQRYEQEFTQAQEQLAQKAQSVDAALIQADAMIKTAEKQILGEISGLEPLKTTDPAQYAIKSAELRDRRDELNNLRNKAIQDYHTQQQQMLEAQQAQRQEFLQQQHALLTDYIPEWRDESTMNKERQEIADYLIQSGLPEAEVSQIANAKVVELARKAMFWDRQTKSKPEAKKKVVSIGKKILKSGKAQTKQAKQTQSKQKDYDAFRKSGDVNAAAKFIEQHLLGDI